MLQLFARMILRKASLRSTSNILLGTVRTSFSFSFRYMRLNVLPDAPSSCMGYDPPAVSYNPLADPALTPVEGMAIFSEWVSGCYQHEEGQAALEMRAALKHP